MAECRKKCAALENQRGVAELHGPDQPTNLLPAIRIDLNYYLKNVFSGANFGSVIHRLPAFSFKITSHKYVDYSDSDHKYICNASIPINKRAKVTLRNFKTQNLFH